MFCQQKFLRELAVSTRIKKILTKVGNHMQVSRKVRVTPRRHALTVAVGFALASGMVHADDFEVTTTDDSGPGSLRQAILDANDVAGPHTISFAPALAGETITLESSLPSIEENLTLQGSEVTLSGAGEHACINSYGVDLEVDGLTIQDCFASYGAAIGVDGGNLVVRNATLTGNTAASYGGAIEVFYANSLLIEDSVISDNASDGPGGGVAATAIYNTTIVGSTISNNSAAYDGGGVQIKYGYEASIADSTVSGNDAGGNGGGLALSTAFGAELDGVNVSDNTADAGGGVFAEGGLRVHSGSVIENNTAEEAGGGLAVISAGYGGPRGIGGYGFVIEDATISGNTAEVAGGFIHVGGMGLDQQRGISPPGGYGGLEIHNSTITGNTADGGGGGIHYGYYSQLSITDSLIADNTADEIGGLGLFAYDSSFTVSSTTISNNNGGELGGGAALFNKYGQTEVVNSTVSGNTAEAAAGLALTGSSYGTAALVGTTITGNAATDGRGGGVAAEAPESYGMALIIANSIIAGNTATVDSPDLSARLGEANGDPTPVGLAAANRIMERIRERFGLAERAGDRPRGERGAADTVFDVSFSLIGTAPDTGVFQPDAASSDVLGEDPELAGLADNGGPTPTHLPAASSPAVNLVPLGEGGCDNSFDIDQRGEPRPGAGSGACDAGSVELQEMTEPGIGLAPDLDFGNVAVGDTAGPLDMTLSSDGDAVLVVEDITGASAPFALDFSDCAAGLPFDLDPGESCALSITFSPAMSGQFDDAVAVTSNATTDPVSAQLTGRGVEGDLVLTPNAGVFGDVEVGDSGELELTLGNEGDDDVQVDDIVGPDAPFSLTGGSCAEPPFVISPGDACTLVFGFAPTDEGDFQDSAQIIVAGLDQPFDFPLSGTGVTDIDEEIEAIPVPTLNRIGLIVGGGLLALMGLFGLRRRRI